MYTVDKVSRLSDSFARIGTLGKPGIGSDCGIIIMSSSDSGPKDGTESKGLGDGGDWSLEGSSTCAAVLAAGCEMDWSESLLGWVPKETD